jgi:hypothetical protein
MTEAQKGMTMHPDDVSGRIRWDLDGSCGMRTGSLGRLEVGVYYELSPGEWVTYFRLGGNTRATHLTEAGALDCLRKSTREFLA